jgi:hypothetical protein
MKSTTLTDFLALLSRGGLPDDDEGRWRPARHQGLLVLFPIRQLNSSDLSGTFVARRTQLDCDGCMGAAATTSALAG